MLKDMTAAWMPQDTETAVKTVMGACIKDLTGLFVYTTYVLGRANQLKSGMKEGAATTLRIAEPLMEEIMDAKKKLQDLIRLYELGEGLTRFVAGGKLNPEIFFPFLDDSKKDITREICENAKTLESVRMTATGTLIASGQNLQAGVATILAQTMKDGIEPKDVMKILVDDAEGRKPYVIINEPSQPNPQVLPKWEIDWSMKGVRGMFESLTCNGQKVFQVKEIITNKEGAPSEIVLFLTAVWLAKPGAGAPEPVRWTIRVNLPEVHKIGTDGHADVALAVPGSEREPKHRFFRPAFVFRNGTVNLEGITEFLKEAIADGTIAVSKRKMNKSSATRRVQESINQAIRHAVNTLPTMEKQVVSKEDTIWSSEFRVVVVGAGARARSSFKGSPDVLNPDNRLSVVDEWKIKEGMLRDLANQGFCINATSKGNPGTIITKVGDLGIPDYVLQVSPFSKYMEMKRLPEMREMASALQLVDAPDLTLTTKGFPLSAALMGRVRDLTIAFFNCNLNEFDDEITGTGTFGHDTMIGCPSLREKIRVKNLRFACSDEDKVEMVKARLIDQGFTEDQMEVVESTTDLGSGLIGKSFEIRLNVDVEDIGKVKSLGAIKGVPTMIPHQLFVVDSEGNRKEIDVVFPMNKKFTLDIALHMAHAKQGKQEINPTKDINTDNLPELKETILAIYEDGSEEVLGEAVVGTLPFYRPVQTGLGLFAVRGVNRGIDVPLHIMPLLNLKHRISKGFNGAFTDKVDAYQRTMAMLTEVKNQMKKAR